MCKCVYGTRYIEEEEKERSRDRGQKREEGRREERGKVYKTKKRLWPHKPRHMEGTLMIEIEQDKRNGERETGEEEADPNMHVNEEERTTDRRKDNNRGSLSH